jgi:hypothetical protein
MSSNPSVVEARVVDSNEQVNATATTVADVEMNGVKETPAKAKTAADTASLGEVKKVSVNKAKKSPSNGSSAAAKPKATTKKKKKVCFVQCFTACFYAILYLKHSVFAHHSRIPMLLNSL